MIVVLKSLARLDVRFIPRNVISVEESAERFS